MQGFNIRYPALSVGLQYRRTGALLAFIAINMRFVSVNDYLLEYADWRFCNM